MLSGVSVKTAPEPKTTVPRPPKRWRNVYWLGKQIELADAPGHAAGVYGPGRFVSKRLWPSRETAEAAAHESIERSIDGQYITYLGPEPVA